MLRSPLPLLLLLPLALGCGGSTDSDSGTGGSSTGGAATGGAPSGGGSGGAGGSSSGGAGSGGCTSLVPCCDSSGKPVDYKCENGMPVCPPGSSFPPTGTCTPPSGTCSPNVPCAADEYCDYPDDKCGAGEPGKCKERPQGCPFLYAPICACDGKVAANDCAAYSSGIDVNANGDCTPPAGSFACGSKFCEIGSSYCRQDLSDVSGYPDTFTCMALPAACNKAPSCACLASETCGGDCSEAGSGELTLKCAGG